MHTLVRLYQGRRLVYARSDALTKQPLPPNLTLTHLHLKNKKVPVRTAVFLTCRFTKKKTSSLSVATSPPLTSPPSPPYPRCRHLSLAARSNTTVCLRLIFPSMRVSAYPTPGCCKGVADDSGAVDGGSRSVTRQQCRCARDSEVRKLRERLRDPVMPPTPEDGG